MVVEQIRLLLADDHTIVRENLATRLGREPGIQIVGQASDSAQILQHALDFQPDVILVDPMMRDGLGLEALREVKSHLPETVCVVLTAFVDTSLQIELRKIGIPHIFLKEVDSGQLIEKLFQVVQLNGHLG